MQPTLNKAEILVEVHRGPILESAHRGHAVIWRHGEGVIASWGDAEARILPRSSSKMIQALPLVESGAADAVGLTTEHLALACASHQSAELHVNHVTRWLADLGLSESDLRCGAQWPYDLAARNALICSHCGPDQRHNTCSGKHTGFLTVTRHLGAGPEYLDIDHPLQRAISEAWDDVTDDTNPDYAIDGCSAPNFVTRLDRMARAMAAFAAARPDGGTRQAAMSRLRDAMMTHPELVSGEGRLTNGVVPATGHCIAMKSGAEGFFVAMVPEQKIGVALKIEDGSDRAKDSAITAILCGLGVLDPAHPAARAVLHGPFHSKRGIEAGHYRIADTLADWRL